MAEASIVKYVCTLTSEPRLTIVFRMLSKNRKRFDGSGGLTGNRITPFRKVGIAFIPSAHGIPKNVNFSTQNGSAATRRQVGNCLRCATTLETRGGPRSRIEEARTTCKGNQIRKIPSPSTLGCFSGKVNITTYTRMTTNRYLCLYFCSWITKVLCIIQSRFLFGAHILAMRRGSESV